MYSTGRYRSRSPALAVKVRQQAAMVDPRRDERRDVRVEADACGIEKQPVAKLARIDRAGRGDRTARSIACSGIEGNAELAREPVTRTAGNHAERGAPARRRLAKLHQRARQPR